MTRVEIIPCRAYTVGKGEPGYLPERPIDLRPGDYVDRVQEGDRVWLEVHRAGFFRRLWHGLRKSL